MTHRPSLLHFRGCVLRFATYDQIGVERLPHEPAGKTPEPSHNSEPLGLKDQNTEWP